MTDLISFVNEDGKVSSKLVAEKFGKRHDHVLRDCGKLISCLPPDFITPNFEVVEIATIKRKGKEVSEVLMSRDGFSLLAMGFTGKAALTWKVKFLDAFSRMERTIASELPLLRSTVAELRAANERLALPSTKRPHHLAGTTLVAVPIETLYGPDIEYRRIPREDDRYSEISRIEGRIAHLSNCMEGMSRSISALTKKASKERRK
jgi:Rha family phage regulatory protein